MENSEQLELTRKDLKIQALLEKVSNLTAQYENQVADLRVEVTLLSAELQEARSPQAEEVSDASQEVEEPTPIKSRKKS